MQQFIGVKLINAKEMTRLAYNELRGWTLPSDENGEDEGYLVEYIDGGKANHPDFAGYISWSPKEVFDRAYRSTSGMNFGLALEALKDGKAIARAGWNGKGMFIYLNHGSHDFPAHQDRPPVIGGVNHSLFENGDTGTVTRMPNINMRAADGSTVTGWLASQTDMLADDWSIV